MVGASIIALISTLIALFSGNLSALLLNALIFALSAGAAAALWLTRSQNAAANSSPRSDNNETLVQLERLNRHFNPVTPPQTALAEACEAALQLHKVNAVLLYALEDLPGASRLRIVAGDTVEEGWPNSLPERLPTGQSWIALSSGTTGRQFPSSIAQYAAEAGYSYGLLEPLQGEIATLGALILLNRQNDPPPPIDRSLMRMLSSLIVSYLDNSHLFKVLETYAIQMAQLTHLSRVTALSNQVNEIAGESLAILSDLLPDKSLALMLAEDDERSITFYTIPPGAGGSQEIECLQAQFNGWPEIVSLLTDSAATTPLIDLNGEEVPDALRQFLQARQLGGSSLYPLSTSERMVGLLIVKGERLKEGDTQLLELAGLQIAAQIQTVRAYEETHRALNQRLDELTLIEDTARQISTSLDFEQIVHQMLSGAIQATGGDVALLAVRGEGEEVWSLTMRDRSGDIRRSFRSSGMRDYLVEQVAMTGQPQNIAELRQANVTVDLTPDFHSLAAVPLERERAIMGVLMVASKRPDFFKSEHLSFLTSLAAHAVISIENARLVEDHEHQIKSLRHLQALTLQVTTADNTRAVADAIIETARNMLSAEDASLFRYLPQSNQVSLIVALKRPESRSSQQATAIPQAALNAARTGEIKVEERIGDNETLISVPIKGTAGIRHILCVMLPPGVKVRQRDLNSLILLAYQIAGHLDNAALLEEIRAGNNRLGAILNSTRDGVVLLDRDGRLIECNPAAERLIGLEKDEVLGQHLVTVLTQSMGNDEPVGMGYSRSELTQLARQLRLEPERITRREFSRETGAQTIHIEEIGGPVRSESGDINGRLLVFRDVTEQQQLSDHRNEITRMMVHDLRGPLWAIQTGLTLAQEDLMDTPENAIARKTLEVAEESARDLMRIVDSLLDIAKLERREMPLNRQFVMLPTLLDAAFNTLLSRILEAEIDLQIDVDGALPPIYADEDIIRRVLLNLIDNALRHTPQGGQILISACQQQSEIKISIADNGAGIPFAERERVFERFRQVKGNIPKRGSRGSGLGLTFCKLAVEAHNGRIWVETTSPLSGANISFTVPTVANSAASS